jgi:hypothetical protein
MDRRGGANIESSESKKINKMNKFQCCLVISWKCDMRCGFIKVS